MPKLIPEHTPAGLDEFTAGYFDAAEWLLDDSIDRQKIRGWHKTAIENAINECRDFQRDNADSLAIYRELSGRNDVSAGIDFWLSRNGHGAGFFDRGDDPVFDQLQDAAKSYGERDTELYRGWLYLN